MLKTWSFYAILLLCYSLYNVIGHLVSSANQIKLALYFSVMSMKRVNLKERYLNVTIVLTCSTYTYLMKMNYRLPNNTSSRAPDAANVSG